MANLVIALGGNALGKTPQQQKELVKQTAKSIVELVKEGHHVIISHGNGPQVGMINLSFEVSSNANDNVPSMPFPECGAMSQGYIGYHIQNAILEELKNNNIEKDVVSIVTQVLVDRNDDAFKNPTKPVGAFYSKEEADKFISEKGYTMVEDSGRGYRRVVPSPMPIDIIEKNIIKNLINNDVLTIAVGGGGIPVYKDANKLIGTPAVIDKDLASSLLAHILDVDKLVILTAVDKISLNFNKPDQIDLDSMTVKEAYEYINAGHFAKGSMLPKVKAALKFVEGGSNRTAIIASLEGAKDAINGNGGTKITF